MFKHIEWRVLNRSLFLRWITSNQRCHSTRNSAFPTNISRATWFLIPVWYASVSQRTAIGGSGTTRHLPPVVFPVLVFPFLLVLAVPFILPPNCHLITYTAYRTYRRIFICTQGDRPGSPGPNKMTRVSRTLAVVQSRVPGYVHADSEQQPLMLKIPSLSHLMSLWQMWTRRSLCGRNQKMDRCVYPPQRKCTHFVRRHSIWRVAEWNVASFAHKLQAHINFSFF